MTVFIKFTSIGIDAGPFNLYSDVGVPGTIYEVGITRQQLLDGFASSNFPDGTNFITAVSTGVCHVQTVLSVPGGMTSTTSTSTSTTTTTTTAPPTTTSTSTALPTFRAWHFSGGHAGSAAACADTTFDLTLYTNYQIGNFPAMGSALFTNSGLTSSFNGFGQWFNSGEAFVDSPIAYQLTHTIDSFFNC